MLPADPPATLDCLKTALDNLVLVATNNTAMLQLTAANLALTNSVAALTATNKKLVNVAASCPRGAPAGTLAGTPAGTGRPAGSGAAKHPFPGNYCWTHSHRISKEHTCVTCLYKAPGHCKGATVVNTLKGTKKDKGW